MIGLVLSAVLLQSDDPQVVVREVLAVLSNQEVKEERKQRIYYFTATWCSACKAASRDFKPWLEKGGWQVDDTPQAHVQLIDADQRPDLVRKFGITSLPTLVLVKDGKEIRRTGYAGRSTIPNLWGAK